MSLLKNYWTETATSVKKIGLALRALITTVAGTGFIQGDVKMAFYVVIAGGILDFILQNLPPDKPNTPGSTPANVGGYQPTSDIKSAPPTGGSGVPALIIALLLLFCVTSCTVVKPQVDRTKTDSTYTTYKQVDIKLTGAKVYAGLNLDSLYHVALMNKDQYKDDSIARLNVELKYKQDSIAALKADKPIPQRPVYIPSPPVKQYVTDPQTKAQLSYWIDAYGKFQITCEAKDQTIATLQAQVNKLTTDKTVTVSVVYKTPEWNKYVMIVLGVLLVVAIVIIVIKSIL
jgi:hypothetical protein